MILVFHGKLGLPDPESTPKYSWQYQRDIIFFYVYTDVGSVAAILKAKHISGELSMLKFGVLDVFPELVRQMIALDYTATVCNEGKD